MDLFLGRGTETDEMRMLEVCRFMGWDFHTYRRQPEHFVRLAMARMSGERLAAEHQKLKEKRR